LTASTAREFFQDLGRRAAGGSERTRGLTATYRFDIDGVGSWRVVIDDGAVSVEESDAAADCVIQASEKTLLEIVDGKRNPMGALLMGKVKLTGDPGLAMRLRDLFAR
jgi:putative sterol carrier protein